MSTRTFCQSLARRVTRLTTSANNGRTVAVSLRCQRCLSNVVDPPDFTPPIPLYVDRGKSETIDNKRARLLYQSRKRGMTENGLLLSTFAHLYLEKLTEEELALYDSLINRPSNDWDLYYWMIGNKPTPEEFDNDVMDKLKKHAQNDDRSVRLQQPDLNQK